MFLLDDFEVRHPKNKKIRRWLTTYVKMGRKGGRIKSTLSSPYRRANFRQRKALRSMRVRSMY